VVASECFQSTCLVRVNDDQILKIINEIAQIVIFTFQQPISLSRFSMSEIVNKVSESSLITIDPADYYPEGERVVLDLKPLLVEEFLLREKESREYIKNHDWAVYQNKFVAIHCSNDALIPVWEYMLLSSALEPYARKIFFGNGDELEKALFSAALGKINPEDFRDRRVVIKGCGNIPVPVSAYVELTRILKPVVKSIMYGEPCSTVPVYKKST